MAACEYLWSAPYVARNSRVAGTRNRVDDARSRCSFARIGSCWGFAPNEVLRFARNIRRIALGRHSIRGGSGPSCRLRFSARGLAILPSLGEVSVEAGTNFSAGVLLKRAMPAL